MAINTNKYLWVPISTINSTRVRRHPSNKLFLISRFLRFKFQKQPSRGVLNKSCSENMQQIYRRTPMLKCDFNKGVCCMRPEIKFTRNEISFRHEKNSVYISLHCGRNEMIFFGFNLLIYSICFYEICPCVDISFRMISFLSKCPQWNNTRNESFISRYFM